MIQLSREEAMVVEVLLDEHADDLNLLERNLRAKLAMYLDLEQTPQLTEQANAATSRES